MNQGIELQRALSAVQNRYAAFEPSPFQLVDGEFLARVFRIVPPDTLQYIVERHDPNNDSWTTVGEWTTNAEEAVIHAREAAIRSRRLHRVVEALLPEHYVWPPPSEDTSDE